VWRNWAATSLTPRESNQQRGKGDCKISSQQNAGKEGILQKAEVGRNSRLGATDGRKGAGPNQLNGSRPKKGTTS